MSAKSKNYSRYILRGRYRIFLTCSDNQNDKKIARAYLKRSEYEIAPYPEHDLMVREYERLRYQVIKKRGSDYGKKKEGIYRTSVWVIIGNAIWS